MVQTRTERVCNVPWFKKYITQWNKFKREACARLHGPCWCDAGPGCHGVSRAGLAGLHPITKVNIYWNKEKVGIPFIYLSSLRYISLSAMTPTMIIATLFQEIKSECKVHGKRKSEKERLWWKQKKKQTTFLYGPPTALAQEGVSREHSNPGLQCSSDIPPYNDQAPWQLLFLPELDSSYLASNVDSTPSHSNHNHVHSIPLKQHIVLDPEPTQKGGHAGLCASSATFVLAPEVHSLVSRRRVSSTYPAVSSIPHAA